MRRRKDNKIEAAAEPELEIRDVRSWWPELKWRCAKKEKKKARSQSLESFSKLSDSKSLWCKLAGGPLVARGNQLLPHL